MVQHITSIIFLQCYPSILLGTYISTHINKRLLFAVLGLKPVQRQLELADRLGFEPTGAQIGLLTLLLSVGMMVLGSFLFPNASATWKES